jgi:hypothetical protein
MVDQASKTNKRQTAQSGFSARASAPTFRLLRGGISVILVRFCLKVCARRTAWNPARRMLTGCKNNYNYQEGRTIED